MGLGGLGEKHEKYIKIQRPEEKRMVTTTHMSNKKSMCSCEVFTAMDEPSDRWGFPAAEHNAATATGVGNAWEGPETLFVLQKKG